MRAVRAATTAAIVLAPLAGVAPAAAGEPAGVICGFSSIADPTAATDTQVGEVDGGPLVLDESGEAVWGSVTCGIVVNGWLHSDPAAVSVTSAVTPGVAFLPPTPVSYRAEPGDYVALCTRVDVVGRGPLYYDYTAGPDGAGGWSTDPETPCQPGYVPGPGPTPLPDPFLIDDLVCPVLALAFPPQGDIPGIWDCPPYEA